MPGPAHRFEIRVYHEDTDHTGVVYHANYLRFIERARSEWVRAGGIDQAALAQAGRAFAVARIEADFLAPARYDDLLEIETEMLSASGARLVLGQQVCRGGSVLVRAEVTIVCVGRTGRPVRLPAELGTWPRRLRGKTVP